MINQETQTLLDKFKEISLFSEQKAILIGGTALAYHLAHRESFDLDICFPFTEKLPELDFLKNFEEVIPFDIEEIEKPKLKDVLYQDLKSYLLNEITKN